MDREPDGRPVPGESQPDPGTAHIELPRAPWWSSTAAQCGAVLVALVLYVAGPVIGAHRAKHDNDFKHMYLGMQALVEREEPYSAQSLLLQAHRHGMSDASLNPYVYLPFTGLSMAFMGPLSVRQASDVWFCINHALALLCAWLIASALWPRWRQLAFACIVLSLSLSHPFYRTLTAGQLNVVLFACYAGAFFALRGGRQALAGSVLGFAAMFKIAPAVFLFYLALSRRWRALAAMVLTCIILLGISVLAVGIQVHLDFVPMLGQMRYGHSTWEELGATFWKDPYNQSINAFLTHIVVAGNGIAAPWFDGGQGVANALTSAVTLVLVGLWVLLLGWTGARRASTGFPDSAQAGFQLTILISLLVPSLMWDHYLIVLLLPAAWAIHYCLRDEMPFAAVAVLLCYGATLVPWAPECALFRSGILVLMMSAKLFPVIILFVLIALLQIRALSHGGTDSPYR